MKKITWLLAKTPVIPILMVVFLVVAGLFIPSIDTPVVHANPGGSTYLLADELTDIYNGQKNLARTSDGTLWATYMREDAETWDYNICCAYSTNNGQTWTEESVTTSGNYQMNPSIAVDSEDNIHIVWEGYGWGTYPDYTQIQYRKRTTSWQTQEAVTNVEYYQHSPSIAIDSQDNIHVVWAGEGTGTYTNQYQIHYRERTTSWQTQEDITNIDNIQAHYGYGGDCVTIAIDSQDNVHVAWRGMGWGDYPVHSQIQYRKRTTSWQTQEAVTNVDGDQVDCSIAVDSEDSIHVVWCGTSWGDYTSHYQVQYRERTTSWQTQEAITNMDGDNIYSSISMDSEDNVHTVWVEGDYVKYRKRTISWQTLEVIADGGGVFEAPVLIWALYPTVSGLKTNRTKTGFALIYLEITDQDYWAGQVYFYKSDDLIWDTASISNTPDYWVIGDVQENADYWAKGSAPIFPIDNGECSFSVTNDGSVAIDISIKATNFTGAGDNWTLTSNIPGLGTVRLLAFKSGDVVTDNVTLTTSDQPFISNLGDNTTMMWELKLETGEFTDGVAKSDNVTLTSTVYIP
ncbi:hypothetical protein MUP46_01025 [Patescibacteria group bacterium]|nr:hypothetical protein [Patescibacteria group bacterium]